MTRRNQQTPHYFAVLTPLAAFLLLIWWMIR
jgi:hypothetical protein